MTPTEAAWMAGLIDGEGTITVLKFQRKSGNCPHALYAPLLTVTNTDKRLIDRCIKLCGGYCVTVFCGRRNPNWKDAYHWRLKSAKLSGVLREVLPFLVSKATQAALAIEVRDDMRVGSKPGRFGTTLTDKERERRDEIWQQLRILNTRGTKPRPAPV